MIAYFVMFVGCVFSPMLRTTCIVYHTQHTKRVCCMHCFDLILNSKFHHLIFASVVFFFFSLAQHKQFNQDLYSTSGVPLTSSSASASSHSPCSPILPQSVALNATQSGGSTTIPTIPLGSLHRSIAKEEDLSSVTRQSDNDGKCQSNFFFFIFQSYHSLQPSPSSHLIPDTTSPLFLPLLLVPLYLHWVLAEIVCIRFLSSSVG